MHARARRASCFVDPGQKRAGIRYDTVRKRPDGPRKRNGPEPYPDTGRERGPWCTSQLTRPGTVTGQAGLVQQKRDAGSPVPAPKRNGCEKPPPPPNSPQRRTAPRVASPPPGLPLNLLPGLHPLPLNCDAPVQQARHAGEGTAVLIFAAFANFLLVCAVPCF
jgi:hypothetical protein